MDNLDYFQVGGTLSYKDNSYVVRQADQKLLTYLQKGDFCFVLNCRQMGKSSLMIQTANKLSQEKVSCAFVDLSALGATQVSDRQWYQSLTYQILESLDLDEFDLDGWWNKYESLAPIDCFSRLIDDVVLEEITNKLVMFIDEIDSIINLDFKDDFFALIRFFYNQRNINRKYQRLSFCLLGVATPPDLIEDKLRTPFNIGRPIELNGFTFAESKTALVPGLSQIVKQPEETLKQVIDWTAGQPFLTQKLCYLIAEKANIKQPDLAAIVKQYVIEDWEAQDYPQHFRTIRDRLLFDKNIAFKLLDIYQQILESDSIIAEDSKIHSKLRFTGLVVKREGRLQVYNPIYREIFNADWIQAQLSNLRPYNIQLDRWLSSQKSPQYLLSDTELRQALEWAEKKSLTRQDYEYLSDSKEEKAQQELQAVEREKNKIVKRGKQSLLGIIVAAIAVRSGTTWYANQQRNEAKKYEFENQSNAISQEFNRGEQLAALNKAISLNNSFKNFNKNKSNITEYSTVKPIETLNNILQQIDEKQQIKLDNINSALAYIRDRQTIIAGGEDGIVARLNIDRDRQWQAFTESRYKGKVIAVDFHPQAEKFITLGREENGERVFYPIKEWTLDGKTVKSLNPQDREEITAVKYSPQGNIAIATNQGEIKLLNKDGTIAKTLLSSNQENITSISFSADNKLLAIATQDGLIQLYNLAGELLAEFTQDDGYKIVALEFSGDDRAIRSIVRYGTISNWYLDPDTLIQQGCKWLSPSFSDEDTDNKAAEICSQF